MKLIKAEAWSGGRFRGIDALRASLRLASSLYHTIGRVDTPCRKPPESAHRFPALNHFVWIHWLFLFFVISGFCIHLAMGLAKAGGRPLEIKFGAFWKRRLSRLYPRNLSRLHCILG